MSVVSLVKDLSMKKFNGITAVCFVDSVYSMLLYLLVYGKKQFESTYFFVSEAISVEVQSKLKYKQFLSLQRCLVLSGVFIVFFFTVLVIGLGLF